MASQSSSTFFCIYSGQEVPDGQKSLEHIVPYSLGGPGTFGTWDVSKKANSDVGGTVDTRLINHPFITFHRWRLGLKSQSGTVPGIEFSGTVEVDGRTLDVVYSINPDGTVDLLTRPEVASDWATGNFRVACDPQDLPTILGNITKKAVKKGLVDGPDDIKVLASKSTRLESPTIHSQLSVGVFDMMPGFAKMALGAGHLVLGETWSRGPDADLLRSVINAKDETTQRAVKVHGSVWPNGDSGHDPLKHALFIDSDHHVVAVLNIDKPVCFYALLFGTFDGFVSLGQDAWTGRELPEGKGVVFVIDCKDRTMTKLDFEEFVVKQMTDKGMLSQ